MLRTYVTFVNYRPDPTYYASIIYNFGNNSLVGIILELYSIILESSGVHKNVTNVRS